MCGYILIAFLALLIGGPIGLLVVGVIALLMIAGKKKG